MRLRPPGGITVYPRACGGTVHLWDLRPPSLGLSPRLRGNRQETVRLVNTEGSIPAPAGEPVGYAGRRGGHGVYPRACGGTELGGPEIRGPEGLSPRLRGNPKVKLQDLMAERSIPAPAGEPEWPRGRCRTERVYPRACGGTVDEADRYKNLPGLSPRLRGNRVGPGG